MDALLPLWTIPWLFKGTFFHCWPDPKPCDRQHITPVPFSSWQSLCYHSKCQRGSFDLFKFNQTTWNQLVDIGHERHLDNNNNPPSLSYEWLTDAEQQAHEYCWQHNFSMKKNNALGFMTHQTHLVLPNLFVKGSLLCLKFQVCHPCSNLHFKGSYFLS